MTENETFIKVVKRREKRVFLLLAHTFDPVMDAWLLAPLTLLHPGLQ